MRFQFDSIDSATDVRDLFESHLCSQDDSRSKTVVLSDDTPESVIRTVQQMSDSSTGAADGDQWGPEGPCGRLSGEQLGALRRSWGAYIGGIEQALGAFQTINEIREGICQDPLGLDLLEGQPETLTTTLINELEATDGALPDGMSGRDLVDAATAAESHQRMAQRGIDKDTDPLIDRVASENVPIDPEELRGVGAVGKGEQELSEALRAEGATEQAEIADALESAQQPENPTATVPENPDHRDISGLVPQGTSTPWVEERASDEDGYLWTHEETAETYDGLGEYAELEVRDKGWRDAEIYVTYTEKIEWDSHDSTGERIELDGPLQSYREAFEVAYKFAAIDPEDRLGGERFGYETVEITPPKGGDPLKVPEQVGDWSLVPPQETRQDGRIAWRSDTIPSQSDPERDEKRVVLYDRSGEWNIGTTKNNDWGKGNGLPTAKALTKAVSHMEKNSADYLEVDTPHFEIEAEAGPILEAFEPFGRYLSDESYPAVHLDVSEGELRAIATDSANVAQYECNLWADDIGAKGQGKYQVETEAEAGLSGALFWRYLSGFNKTDRIRIELEGGNTRNSIPRVRFYKNGEEVMKYDGHRNEVPVYLYPHDESVTVIRGRPDTPDWDPAFLGEIAEIRDFKDLIRKHHKDNGGVWLLHDEGHFMIQSFDSDTEERVTDELIGASIRTVDNVADQSGVMFSTEYLRDLTLSVPKPASNKIDFSFGIEPGADHDIAENKRNPAGPLEMSYQVGETSTVQHMIAPRIARKDNDNMDFEL